MLGRDLQLRGSTYTTNAGAAVIDNNGNTLRLEMTEVAGGNHDFGIFGGITDWARTSP